MSEVETQKYTIIGLVDEFDEQGNITGQLPIGSVQELPVEIGNPAVEDGRAELYVEDDQDESNPEQDPLDDDSAGSDDEADGNEWDEDDDGDEDEDKDDEGDNDEDEDEVE